MKQTYMVYKDKEERSITLFDSEQLEFILKKDLAGENAQFFIK